MEIRKMLFAGTAVSMLVFCTSKTNAFYIRQWDSKGNVIPPTAALNEKIGGKAEGFKLSLESEKSVYILGEPVHLSATIANVGRDGVGLSVGPLFPLRLDILCPDDTFAPLTSAGREKASKPVLRADTRGGPGNIGSKVDVQFRSVNADFDMTQPGEYSLQVSREVPSLKDPKKQVTIYSNVVKITIAAPQEDDEDAPED